MSVADILIIIIVSIIMLSIIFFSVVYPRLKGKKGKCMYCPINKDKKIKRGFKDYHKKQK